MKNLEICLQALQAGAYKKHVISKTIETQTSHIDFAYAP